jgi:hypothetical protein
MIIGLGLCRLDIGSFCHKDNYIMVVDHDNYEWSFGQQLCAIMTKVW